MAGPSRLCLLLSLGVDPPPKKGRDQADPQPRPRPATEVPAFLKGSRGIYPRIRIPAPHKRDGLAEGAVVLTALWKKTQGENRPRQPVRGWVSGRAAARGHPARSVQGPSSRNVISACPGTTGPPLGCPAEAFSSPSWQILTDGFLRAKCNTVKSN